MALRRFLIVASLLACLPIQHAWAQEQASIDRDALLNHLNAQDAKIRELEARLESQSNSIRMLPVVSQSNTSVLQRIDALEARFASENLDSVESGFKEIGIQTKPNFNINGRLFLDHIMYDDSAFVDRENETGFDTARIGASGNVFENTKYKIEVEFEGTEVDYKDVFIEINNLPWVGNARYGHFKEPFSLEELTSSRFLTWMERSIAYQAFVPQRNFGFMLHDYFRCNENLSWFAGIFRGDFDDSPTAQGSMVQDDSDWSFTTRVA